MLSLRLRLVLKALPWMLLEVAFVLFGVWIRFQVPRPIGCGKDTEIYSFDFLGYAATLSDFKYIGYGRFRHPLFLWLMSPITLFAERFQALGPWYYWVYMLTFFAAFAVLSAYLVRRILLRFGGLTALEAMATTCLFLSFAHVWLLAGMPETFGLSMLLALATINWALGSSARRKATRMRILNEVVEGPKLGARIDLAGWIALAVLTGGITLTQAVKTALAYSLTTRRWLRTVIKMAVVFVVVVSLVVLVFYVRVHFRVSANPYAPGMNEAWHTLVDHFAPLAMTLGERFGKVWVFFSEPIILRGENFDVRVITQGYDSLLQTLLLAVLYFVVICSAWLNRRTLIVRLLGVMFLVDVGLHMIAGWGLTETQLYGGHWMYGVPLCVGLLLPRLKGKKRQFAVFGVFLLAALIFVSNIHGYFCHDVGFK